MLALGYDKPCGSGVAFEVSPFLGPGGCWYISGSSLKAASAPLPHPTLLKYTELLFNRLPSTVPVEKIPHDLCPVPQPDTTGKAAWHQQDPYFKDLLPVWRGMSPKRERVVYRGSGPLHVSIVSCWG